MNISSLNDRAYPIRVVLMGSVGLCAALFLTWFMYSLIQASHQELDESKRVHLLDFVRVKKTEQSERIERKPQRPAQAPAPPAPPVAQSDSSAQASGSMVIEMPSATSLDSSMGGLSIEGGDGEFLPIIKVAPIYPPRAEQMGLEGNCSVTYTVTTIGTVRNISVLKGYCDNAVFEKPSIKAAEKFKYKPRVINGEAVEVEGVVNQFQFKLRR